MTKTLPPATRHLALVDEVRAPEYSDDTLALEFSDKHADELLFVPEWGRWLRWDGGTWRADKIGHVFNLSRARCRESADRLRKAGKNAQASTVASAKTVAAVVRLAMTDPRHTRATEAFDGDSWLLNCKGGVVDLRTGQLRPARRSDHMTKCTAAMPDEECPTPRWEALLARATQGDHELQAFLQRVAGYAITGSVREHALFFVYGLGGNGKGVFLNTLTRLLGDYAAVSEMETFTAAIGERHPTELAMLRGARLVAAQETEDGRRWAESRLKALTGGDPVSARFMRQDFFTYSPQFKLLIAGNHKPGLRNVDEAMRRRLHLIPFTATIPASERDPQLTEKLQVEWPGILAWAVRGCLAWQAEGLRPPAAVTAATEEYFAAEDALATWLDQRCMLRPSFECPVAELFDSWRRWAEETGEHVGSLKRFSQRLQERGFEPVRMGHLRTRGYSGITLQRGVA